MPNFFLSTLVTKIVILTGSYFKRSYFGGLILKLDEQFLCKTTVRAEQS